MSDANLLPSPQPTAPMSGFSPHSTAAANMMICPDGMTRAFARQLNGRQTGYQAMPPPSLANHSYVYAQGYGVMPLIPNFNVGSDAAAPLACPAFGATEPNVAPVQNQHRPAGNVPSIDGLLNSTSVRSVAREMPQWKSISTVSQAWQPWEEGSLVELPLKRLTDRVLRPTGFKRQRFQEWKDLAREIDRRATERSLSKEAAAQQIDAERVAEKRSVAGYVQRLGK